MKVYDLLLLFLQKKMFFVLGMAHTDLFFLQGGSKNGSKNGNIKWFYHYYFRTTGLQLQLLILI